MIVGSVQIISTRYGSRLDVLIPAGMDAEALTVRFLRPDGQPAFWVELEPGFVPEDTEAIIEFLGGTHRPALILSQINQVE